MLRLRATKDEAIALLDAHPELLARSPELLNLKASALFDKWLADRQDEASKAAATETFAAARGIDPSNVDAHFSNGWFLLVSDRPGEAHPLLKAAARLTPSTRVHSYYWNAVAKQDDIDLEDRRNEVEADVDALLRLRPAGPALLAAIAVAYERLDVPEKQEAFEDKVLSEHANSRQAERILASRAFMAAGDPTLRDDPEKSAAWRETLRDFIARKHHQDETALGQAYLFLFHSLKDDPSVDAAELYAVIQGMRRHVKGRFDVVYGESAAALAERKAYFREAEELTLEGVRKAAMVLKDDAIPSERRRQIFDELIASMRAALGWVYFNEGRVDEAQRELLSAYEQSRDIAVVQLRLAMLYAARGEREKTEAWYVRCLSTPTLGDHPCEAALRDDYAERQSLSGYDDTDFRLNRASPMSEKRGFRASGKQSRFARRLLFSKRSTANRFHRKRFWEKSSSSISGAYGAQSVSSKSPSLRNWQKTMHWRAMSSFLRSTTIPILIAFGSG